MSDRGPYIDTITGARLYLRNPRPEDIHLEDIAHALSRMCRFTGHTQRLYSVAEHSLNVAHSVVISEVEAGRSPDRRLEALLHDAQEAYIGDITSPMKVAGLREQLEEIERPIKDAIAVRFDLFTDDRTADVVKSADLVWIGVEARDLVHVRDFTDWGCDPPPENLRVGKERTIRDIQRAFLNVANYEIEKRKRQIAGPQIGGAIA